MKVFISNNGNSTDFGAIVSSHKVRLGNKYAFLFNKEVISKAKSNCFPRPPKRTVALDLDAKLEEDATTSTSSGDSADHVLTDTQVKVLIAAGVDEQSTTTKKLLEGVLNFEEFLCSSGICNGDAIREVRKFTRFLISNVLQRKDLFHQVARDSISLGAIVLATERFELDRSFIFAYVTKEYQIKRITKLGKVKQTRAYTLLNSMVESFNAAPSSP
jgi:hypothetical protein